MSLMRWCFVCGLLVHSVPAAADTDQPVKVLRAYGPGGVQHVLQECADLFRQRHGVSVAVYKASPPELAKRVPEDGDIYYGGAEYMLEEFARQNPGVIDLRSVEKLHPRRIGVVVRKGNPLGIKGLACLQRQDVDLLAARLENMAEFHVPRGDRGISVRRTVATGQEAFAAWRSSPELDAWVTYKSWHVWLEEESEFIEIPGDDALRYTPVALTRRTPNRQMAMRFITFLKSPEARRIFVEHGWE